MILLLISLVLFLGTSALQNRVLLTTRTLTGRVGSSSASAELDAGSNASAKDKLLGLLSPSVGGEFTGLIDPYTRAPLVEKVRYFGLVQERFLSETGSGATNIRKYAIRPLSYIDLTIQEEVGKPLWEISNRERISSRLFQNPIMSSFYERGYRQNFQNAGFPGIDKEYAEAEKFFLENVNGSGGSSKPVVLDLSCGSGFMSRKFVKSHKFSRVISADLSPNMLMETRQRCVKEGLSPPLLIRADAAKLPFADNSISAVHAGAAMHCWPRLPEALAEVHRVLKPGGKFFASTFFTTAFTAQPITGMTSQAGASSGMYMFSGESEILDLLRDAGFGVDEGAETERSGDGAIGAVATDTKATVRREGRGCAIVKAVK